MFVRWIHCSALTEGGGAGIDGGTEGRREHMGPEQGLGVWAGVAASCRKPGVAWAGPGLSMT